MEEIIATAAEETAEAPVAEEALPKKKQRKPINQQKLQDNLWGWIFCIPLIIGTVWFIYSALVIALLLSFTSYDMGSGQTLWEVLGNLGGNAFKEEILEPNKFGVLAPSGKYADPNPFYWYIHAFTDKVAKPVGSIDVNDAMNEMGAHLFNTVFYMIGIPIGMILSIFFAVCMSRDIKGGNLFRVLYYIPCVASTISIIYTFNIMFRMDGVINNLLGTKIDWLTTAGSGALTWQKALGKDTASGSFMLDAFWCQGIISKSVIVIMSVWKGLGGTIILYVAGLSGVNMATKEAAQIDGANGWKIFWKVTMPDLYPTIFYNIVTSVIGGMQIYAEPTLFFGESYLTSGYVSLVYKYGLAKGATQGTTQNPSRGAVYGMILAVIIFVLTLFQFWLDSRKKD